MSHNKSSTQIEITHNQKNRVFHSYVNGRECYLKYRKLGPTMLEYYETFVPYSERKKGIASALAEEALEFAKDQNLNVAPTCNFVASYMDDHRKYDKYRVRVKGKEGGTESFITS